MTDSSKISVSELRAHPENERIYGDGADEVLLDSIRLHGILTPLLVTQEKVIVSGHRRWQAAKRIGLAEVPVAYLPPGDDLDTLQALLESNRQREKTGEQLGREQQVSQRIEADRARRRQLASLKHNGTASIVPENFPERAARGDARDIAAQRLGVSGRTAERAAVVVQVVDDLKEQGKDAEAERLRRELNNRSIHSAWKQAREQGYIKPAHANGKTEALPIVSPAAEASNPETMLLTLDAWNSLTPAQRTAAMNRPRGKQTFNEQKNTDIEWAQWSWNPVTGCLHGCSFCYARDIALNSSAYPQKFAPTFLPERLGAPANTKVPARAEEDIGFRNVFTCSMADLFGRWVPREWIDAVLHEVRSNPQWNFLFLTKFPNRLQEFVFPDNAWVGTTVDAQARVKNAEQAMEKVQASVRWLSCEPLLEPLYFSRLDLFQWIVIGGASRSSETPEWRPPRQWVNSLEEQARIAGCRIYEKANLLDRLRQYPGVQPPAKVNVPGEFKMGYLQRDVLEPERYAEELASAGAPDENTADDISVGLWALEP